MAHPDGGTCDRRTFLGATIGCGAYVAAMAFAGAPGTRRLFAAQPYGAPVAVEPWGRLERVAEGVWALVSTPLADRRTLSNGGIIAGRDGVLVVEGLASIEGAAWLAESALRLTGRRPTHVVLTHYHGDHTAGTAGMQHGAEPLAIVASRETRRLLLDRELQTPADRPTARKLLLPDTLVADAGAPTEIDLGGRVVRIHARSGHTPSDLTVELVDPRIVWCGDLVWNGMFPNYVDAIPSRLSTQVAAMLEDHAELYVPGHGSLADAAGLRPYKALLDDVAAAATSAFERGVPADRAAADYRLPDAVADWTLFSPSYFRVAFEAWARDLAAHTTQP